MKKIFSIIVLTTVFLTSSFGQKSFNSGQQALRDNIMSYLREEGYQPSIDSDGDIKFKVSGDSYFLIVSDKESSPYFISLVKFYSYGEKITKTKIRLYSEELQKYRTIKIIIEDDGFGIKSEMFLINSVAFTSIFKRLIRIFDGVENEIKDELL